MRSFVILVLLSTVTMFGQTKKQIINEIYSYKKGIVDTVYYKNKRTEVWNAIYIISKEEYSIIVRESESRGYIEAKEEKELFKEFFTAEIIGEGPFRVSFQVSNQEQRTKDYIKNTYTPWVGYVSNNLNFYYLKLHLRLYELLKGKIELPKDLLDKIATFNNSQKKEKNKILKGIDY